MAHGSFDTTLHLALKPCFCVAYSAGTVRQRRPLLPQAGFGRTTSVIQWGKTCGMRLYVPARRDLPEAAWNTDEVWQLRATYRTRDLQAVRIEGNPAGSPNASI